MTSASRVVAVLGPTNTGKTHYAIDRMLGYRTGIMGFPLRLLAREVYDKIVKLRGPSVVALVTGEERIVPPRAQYWICTVEAMPEGMGCDFLAIDEIQLCADPERGHVFTDRLLRSRGLKETLFLGADTMRGPISALVPGVEFMRRERMSELVYAGSKKISRMPPRTARLLARFGAAFGLSEKLVPTTTIEQYVQVTPFEGNTLTTDADMYAFLQLQMARKPDLVLGGPTVQWLAQAMIECAALREKTSPDVPCVTFLGENEQIVSTEAVHDRMTRWPSGTLDLVPEAQHEILMEQLHIRTRVCDAIATHFKKHKLTQ